MAVNKITTEAEFRDIQNKGKGLIVITDGTNNKLHVVSCPNIDFYYFYTKVIKNKEKNGSYFWSDSLENFKSKFDIIGDCLHCKHLYNKKI